MMNKKRLKEKVKITPKFIVYVRGEMCRNATTAASTWAYYLVYGKHWEKILERHGYSNWEPTAIHSLEDTDLKEDELLAKAYRRSLKVFQALFNKHGA
jgi:hypothetical protein